MEDVAQSVERRFVVPNVAGSSPVILPTFFFRKRIYAPVAQLDRASDFESAGRRFESCRARFCGPLAQLAEQRTLNPQVEGSSPSWPTTHRQQLREFKAGIFRGPFVF